MSGGILTESFSLCVEVGRVERERGAPMITYLKGGEKMGRGDGRDGIKRDGGGKEWEEGTGRCEATELLTGLCTCSPFLIDRVASMFADIFLLY